MYTPEKIMVDVRRTLSALLLFLLIISCAAAQEAATTPPDTLFQRGMKSYAEGQYRKAIEAFAAIGDTASPRTLFYAAMSHLSLNDVQRGIPLLQKAVTLEPSNTGYRFQYARILAQSGSADLAASEYAALIAADSAFIAARYQLGLLHYEQKRYPEALEQFNAVVDLNPGDYLSHYYMSSSLINLAQVDSARPYLASCISLNPKYTPAITLLASIYYGAGEHQEALRLYKSASAQRPQDPELSYKIGLCYGKLGRIDSALAYTSRAARRDTANDLYIAQTGYYHLVQERYDSALASYRKAIQIDGENSLYFINMAYAFSQTKANDSAVAAYEQGVAACRPENIAAIYLRLGTLHYYRKQYRKALSSYQQALDLQPMNREAQYYVALAYDQLANPQSAIRQYRKYLALAREDTTAAERERKKQAGDRLRTLRR